MTMTRKLYYEDVYLGMFEARVLECRECEKGYAVVLDQTAFYPEGGGQPADSGSLEEVPVKDVQEKDGEILHYTEEPFTAGQIVHGRIDWKHRFDLMQKAA